MINGDIFLIFDRTLDLICKHRVILLNPYKPGALLMGHRQTE